MATKFYFHQLRWLSSLPSLSVKKFVSNASAKTRTRMTCLVTAALSTVSPSSITYELFTACILCVYVLCLVLLCSTLP